MEELITLPGVARKTANIVLAVGYGKVIGMAIDTHMIRLNTRMGFTTNTNPDKIEKDLTKLLPKEKWKDYTYLIIEHGRAVCKAPIPLCSRCILDRTCPKSKVIKNK
jgi:endonuclease-3